MLMNVTIGVLYKPCDNIRDYVAYHKICVYSRIELIFLTLFHVENN